VNVPASGKHASTEQCCTAAEEQQAFTLCVSSRRAQALSCDGEENRPDHSALVSPTSQRARLQVDRERTLSEGAQQHRKDRHALTEETSRLAQVSAARGSRNFPKPLRFSLADNQESPPARG